MDASHHSNGYPPPRRDSAHLHRYQMFFRSTSDTVREEITTSGHLYQHFAHLKNAEAITGEFDNAEGISPDHAVGEQVEIRVKI